MYWQKRFDREDPDREIEAKLLEIRKSNKDYGYRRMLGELHNQGYVINKKKVQRIMQKLGLQVTSFTHRVLTKEKWERLHLIESTDVSIHIYCIRK